MDSVCRQQRELLLDNVQAEADAACTITLPAVHLEIGLPDPRTVLRGNPDPGINDVDPACLSEEPHRNEDAPALEDAPVRCHRRSELHRVRDEVHEDAPQHGFIALDQDPVVRNPHSKLDPLLARFLKVGATQLADQWTDLQHFHLMLDLAAVIHGGHHELVERGTQHLDRLPDVPDLPARLGFLVPVDGSVQQGDVTVHGGHGLPQVVTHRGQEPGLFRVGLLGTAALEEEFAFAGFDCSRQGHTERIQRDQVQDHA